MSDPNDVEGGHALPKRRRRWRLLAAFVALGLVLYFVPFVPYSPSCGHFKNLKGKMSKEFRSAVTEQLIYFDRTYIVVDGLILLRLPDWTGWALFDEKWNGDIMINVNNKALRSVVRERDGSPRNPITIDRHGPATEAEYEALLDRATDCEIARQFVILPEDD